MRLRTRDSMGMGEKYVLALRYLLEADRAGTPMSPRDLASKLGISSASTTTLLDRLSRSGHVARRPHPTDRRALVIVATQEADCEVRSTLGAMHERMLRAARDLSAEEAATVTAFLHAMAEAVGRRRAAAPRARRGLPAPRTRGRLSRRPQHRRRPQELTGARTPVPALRTEGGDRRRHGRDPGGPVSGSGSPG